MGIFDGLFNKKKKDNKMLEEKELQKEIDVTKEIETIILILENLKTLDQDEIEDTLNKLGKDYDKSIFYRLRIYTDTDKISYFRKYFTSAKIGYGDIQLEKIKEELNKRAIELANAGRNKAEIIEELIYKASIEIRKYEDIILTFNEILKKLDTKNTNEAERIAMIEFWTNHYKEQQLGYSINLDKKLNAMIKNLKSLEYGGYGEIELERFKRICQERIEAAKKNNTPTNKIISEIETLYYNPLINRYKTDLDILKRRIRTIENSQEFDHTEKERRKQEVITDFNERKGHIINLEEKISELVQDLQNLEYGGYGQTKIAEFKKRTKEIIDNGKKLGKSDKELLTKIKIEYNTYIEYYEKESNILKQMLKRIKDSVDYEDRKEVLLQNFKDKMGHPIDIEARVERMIYNLKNLPQGGYGVKKIREFTTNVDKVINENKESSDKIKTINELELIYNIMINEYQTKLTQLQATIKRIEENENLTEKEKEASKNEFTTIFKIETGHALNFDKVLSDFAEKLKKLPHGGYGESAIKEFKKECIEKTKDKTDDDIIYRIIRQCAAIYENNYLNNLEIFTKWEKRKLASCKDNDKASSKEQLDKQIKYMLSLSPKALNEYYAEDDKKKKAALERHNLLAAHKFLAKQEAKKSHDKTIIEKRLKEFEEGKSPYTEEEIEEAIKNLEMIALFDQDPTLSEEDKIQSSLDYIDNTLYRQLSIIKTATEYEKLKRKHS